MKNKKKIIAIIVNLVCFSSNEFLLQKLLYKNLSIRKINKNYEDSIIDDLI